MRWQTRRTVVDIDVVVASTRAHNYLFNTLSFKVMPRIINNIIFLFTWHLSAEEAGKLCIKQNCHLTDNTYQ